MTIAIVAGAFVAAGVCTVSAVVTGYRAVTADMRREHR